MVYNDYVVCDVKKIKTPAIFIANRPDKNTIVVEYQEKLYEVDADKVRLATHREITYYFRTRITGLEQAITNSKQAINKYVENLVNYNSKILKQKPIVDEWILKKEGLLVAKRLVGSKDPNKVFYLDIQISEVSGSGKYENDKLERLKDAVCSVTEHLEAEKEYLDQLTRRVNRAYAQFDSYKEKVGEVCDAI